MVVMKNFMVFYFIFKILDILTSYLLPLKSPLKSDKSIVGTENYENNLINLIENNLVQSKYIKITHPTSLRA